MNRSSYEEKDSLLLSDGPYAVLPHDPTLSYERKITKHLSDLKHWGLLPKKKYWTVLPSGSHVPLFYGLLKKFTSLPFPLAPLLQLTEYEVHVYMITRSKYETFTDVRIVTYTGEGNFGS